ncbi:hypothetical protein E2K99_20355 [Herbaspirillum huttiense]|jgi:hypothetical protein|uniref:hypothetical protein n=1 Tax=Herbaspirillum huttiense TaxID=863372 RepID=UPI0010651CD4|nr:hypothetical protein [Herbaspirillum huttiense]QBP77190.1 hypothetical protein E2K99_20355 [Herbaspirillum huttiense]
MDQSDIRPRSTYIGNGGITRTVQSINMDLDGRLIVYWRAVRPKKSTEPIADAEALEQFAEWAKAIKDTQSSDLRHYFS